MIRKTASALKEPQADLLGGVAQPTPKAKSLKVGDKVTGIEPGKESKIVSVKTGEASTKTELTVVKNNPANTLAVIADALKDPKFNPENMRLVLDMHKEMVAEQARLEFTEAMRALKRKLPVINKDGRIEFKDKGSGKALLRFASFENIHEIITPLLDEFGFDLWFSSEPGVAGMINVIGNLEHSNGARRSTILPMPHDASGGKSGAQGWASAFSFGKRIATIGLLNILTKAPEDRDLDGNRPKVTKGGKPQVIEGDVAVDGGISTVEVCSEDQLAKVREAIESCGVPEKTFCKHFEIDKVSQLPAASYSDALTACRSYAEKRK